MVVLYSIDAIINLESNVLMTRSVICLKNGVNIDHTFYQEKEVKGNLSQNNVKSKLYLKK